MTLIELCRAVQTELAAHAWTPTFAPVIQLQPALRADALAALHVTIAPKSLDVEPRTRTTNRIELAVDIGIAQQVDEPNSARAESLLELTEAIAAYMSGRRLVAAPQLANVSVASDPIYDREHLRQTHIWLSVITCTYRGTV